MRPVKMDVVKEIEHVRDEVVRGLEYAEVLLNLMSVKDELLRETWKQRAQTVAVWADDAESHCNAMIDVLLR